MKFKSIQLSKLKMIPVLFGVQVRNKKKKKIKKKVKKMKQKKKRNIKKL